MRTIDADALKEDMFDYYWCVKENTTEENYHGETLKAYEVTDLIEDCIANAPTIDAAPVVYGRWVKKYSSGIWDCSVCGVRMELDGTPKDYLMHYCPNCGAKMDGKKSQPPATQSSNLSQKDERTHFWNRLRCGRKSSPRKSRRTNTSHI